MANRIIELAKNDYIAQMSQRYTNALFLDGIISQRPKVIKSDRGESVSFILHQISREGQDILDKSFSCMAYNQPLVEKLKSFNKVPFIKCKGKLTWSPKLKSYSPVIIEMEVVELLDEELEEIYDRERIMNNGK